VVDPTVLFADYSYVPSTSSTMRSHFEALSADMVSRLRLNAGDLVIDVGSNDGLLLSCFQRRGIRVQGIEPADNLAQLAQARNIPTVNAFLTVKVARELAQVQRAALVCATNVFAHVDDIRGFLRAAVEVLSDDGVFLVEVQSFPDTVASLAFDMTYHEHLTYYATAPLARLCAAEGLALLHVERVSTHGGSLRALIGRPEHPLSAAARVRDQITAEAPFTGASACSRFARGVQDVRRDLRSLIASLRSAGGRIAGYGAPAKATVLLNYCGLGPADIAYVVDRNTAKQGRFIPGVDIPVVGPDRLATDAPTHLLLLAWNLADEIAQEQFAFRAAGGRFVVPVPTPRVLA